MVALNLDDNFAVVLGDRGRGGVRGPSFFDSSSDEIFSIPSLPPLLASSAGSSLGSGGGGRGGASSGGGKGGALSSGGGRGGGAAARIEVEVVDDRAGLLARGDAHLAILGSEGLESAVR